MGVKGLQAYVEQCCPKALVNVNLHRVASEYHQRHGRQPILVIDGMALLRKFYNPGIPFAYGGEWLELLQHIRTFLETLKNANIKPVFIFDGVIEPAKRATWLDRRKKERRLVSQIFQHIKRTSRHPDRRMYHIPPCISGCFRKALKYLGAECIKSSIEADREIFHYYKKHQCFGVLSHDSDFIIYDIDKHFAADSLDLKKLYVKMYNKQFLCNHLGIHPRLLPLLACLLGNDTISPNSLTRFHHWVTGIPRDGRLSFQTTVPCCADFLGCHGSSLSDSLIAEVESQVIRFPGMEGVFQKVIHDYTHIPDDSQPVSNQPQQQEAASGGQSLPSSKRIHPQSKEGIEKALLQNAKQGERHSAILEILSQVKTANFVRKVLLLAETDCNMSFEDDNDQSMPSAGILLRPIRQRLYGVIFGIGCKTDGLVEETNPDAELVVGVNAVNEYYAYAGYGLKDPDVVAATPLDLPGGTPTLEDIYTKPKEDTLHLRQQAVLSCLHCKIDESLLIESLPRQYVALCCLVHYFVKDGPESMMNETDVDAFVAQAVCIGLHTAQSIWSLMVPRVDPRGVHLGTIFMRALGTFWEINAACAEPFNAEDSYPWRCFDGKLFHIKYIMAQDGASMDELCQQNAEAIKEFQLLKKCITMGTRMEQH